MRAILTYHSIDRSGSSISISPEAFDDHVRWFASGRARVVSIDELMALPDDTDAVALTFDDGFETFATVAWPRLRAHGLRATLFVVSAHVGGLNDWGDSGARPVPRLPLLGWDRLGSLASDGVQLGAHSRRHPDLTRLHPRAAIDEIDGSARDIQQHTGVVPRVFAYPFGHVTPAVAGMVANRFPWGVTTELRRLRAVEDATRLPRLDAYYFQRPGHLAQWGSGRFRRFVRRRAAARRLKSVLRIGRGPAC